MNVQEYLRGAVAARARVAELVLGLGGCDRNSSSWDGTDMIKERNDTTLALQTLFLGVYNFE